MIIHRLHRLHRLARSIAIATIAVATLVAVAPASAAINPASYRLVDVTGYFPNPYGATGGYFFCPPYMRAVAWGATSSGLRDTGITAGFTDGSSDRGVFVTGTGSGGQQLRMTARCVDDAQLQGSTLATAVVSNQSANGNHYGGASCPPGTVAYGGGHYFPKPNGQASAGYSVYASMPGASGTFWVAGASGPSDLVVVTQCLPRSQFGQIVTVTATDTAPDEWPRWPRLPGPLRRRALPGGLRRLRGRGVAALLRLADAPTRGIPDRLGHDV